MPNILIFEFCQCNSRTVRFLAECDYSASALSNARLFDSRIEHQIIMIADESLPHFLVTSVIARSILAAKLSFKPLRYRFHRSFVIRWSSVSFQAWRRIGRLVRSRWEAVFEKWVGNWTCSPNDSAAENTAVRSERVHSSSPVPHIRGILPLERRLQKLATPIV